MWASSELASFSMVSLDLPGFGDTGPVAGCDYSLSTHAAVCRAVMKTVDTDQWVLVGHSMGGAVTLLMDDPDLPAVTPVISLEGNLIAEDCGMISRQCVREGFTAFSENWFPAFRARMTRSDRRQFDLSKADPEAFFKSAESLVAWSDSGTLVERFKRFGNRCYFYGGRNENMPVLDVLRGDTPLVRINRAGHFMMNDQPATFCRKLRAVLESSNR
jgi:pimeloyl-ACP methyl ester carboxylesterase